MEHSKKINVVFWFNIIFAIIFIFMSFFVSVYSVGGGDGVDFGIKIININYALECLEEFFQIIYASGIIGGILGLTYLLPTAIILYFIIASISALIRIIKIIKRKSKGENAEMFILTGRMSHVTGVMIFASFQLSLLFNYVILPTAYILLVGYIVVLIINNCVALMDIEDEEVYKQLLTQIILNMVETVLVMFFAYFSRKFLFEIYSFGLLFAGNLGNWPITAIATVILMCLPFFIITEGLWSLNCDALNHILSEEMVLKIEKDMQAGIDIDKIVEPRKPIWNIIFAIIITLSLIFLKMFTETAEITSMSQVKEIDIFSISRINIDFSVIDKITFEIPEIGASKIDLGVGWFGYDKEVVTMIVFLISWAIITVIRSKYSTRKKKNKNGLYLYKMFKKM